MQYNTIIEYIIEQADRYDKYNLQFEQDIKFNIRKHKNKLDNDILMHIVGIPNKLVLSQLMTRIQMKFSEYTSNVTRTLLDTFHEHNKHGYKHTDQYINMGEELNRKFSRNVLELQQKELVFGDESVKYIQEHAFDLLKGHSSEKVEKLRGELGLMLLSGKTSKEEVRNAVSRVLNVNASKAEEIAQTELSRAYNYGTISRLHEYNKQNPDNQLQKYWYGFKYSEVTCSYCRPRIGMIYHVDDNEEVLPAHIRCRCVWLPILKGWDEPIFDGDISELATLKTIYTVDDIYSRLNDRLGISYSKYVDPDVAYRYIGGERTQDVLTAISLARSNAIDDIKEILAVQADTTGTMYAKAFNEQTRFWKNLISSAIIDNDIELVNKSIDAIKAIMLLPWNSSQLYKWEDLLSTINNI